MVGIMSSWRRQSDPTGSRQSFQPAIRGRRPIPISRLPHGRRPISISLRARQPMVIGLQRGAGRTIKVQEEEEEKERKRRRKSGRRRGRGRKMTDDDKEEKKGNKQEKRAEEENRKWMTGGRVLHKDVPSTNQRPAAQLLPPSGQLEQVHPVMTPLAPSPLLLLLLLLPLCLLVLPHPPLPTAPVISSSMFN